MLRAESAMPWSMQNNHYNQYNTTQETPYDSYLATSYSTQAGYNGYTTTAQQADAFNAPFAWPLSSAGSNSHTSSAGSSSSIFSSPEAGVTYPHMQQPHTLILPPPFSSHDPFLSAGVTSGSDQTDYFGNPIHMLDASSPGEYSTTSSGLPTSVSPNAIHLSSPSYHTHQPSASPRLSSNFPVLPTGASARSIGEKKRKRSNSNSGRSGICDWRDEQGHMCGRDVRDLKSHKATHEAERPHRGPLAQCQTCTKGFARGNDMWRHVRGHLSKHPSRRQLQCALCPPSVSSTFEKVEDLRTHCVNTHVCEKSRAENKKIPSGTTNRKSKSSKTHRDASPFSSTSPIPGPVQPLIGKKFAEEPLPHKAQCDLCHCRYPTAQKYFEHLLECTYKWVCNEAERGVVFDLPAR